MDFRVDRGFAEDHRNAYGRPGCRRGMDGEYDVVVVGAGVIGCAVADALAPDVDVLVLDRAGVAMGATGRAAGLVTPTLFYGDLPAVARHANAFFRSFDGTEGFSFVERRRFDYVAEGEASTARDRAATLADAGFPVDYLDAEAVDRAAPRLRIDGFAGAVRYDDAGWVDPYEFATALRRRATANGATFLTDRPATGVAHDHVRLADRRIEAGNVVVAAGWRTPDLVDAPLPIRPYRTQCVVLEPAEPLDDDFPLGRVGSEGLYFRPEHEGTLLVGGGHELVDDPDAASDRADGSYVERVATVVPRYVRGVGDAGLVNGWAGVDSASPDARPIVDRVDGVVVATGFNGLGIVAAPVAAALVESLVTDPEGDSVPFDRAPFALDRFADRGADFAFTATSDIGR